MAAGPTEEEVLPDVPEGHDENMGGDEFIDQLEPSQAWTSWRDNLATQMFVAYEWFYLSFLKFCLDW